MKLAKRQFNKSVVINADGSLRRVYHGTKAPAFDKFYAPKQVWVGPGMNDVRDIHEIYFTDNMSVARTYGRVEEVYLFIERPLEIEAQGKRWGDIHPSHYVSEAILSNCDGVIVKNIRDAATGGGALATTFIVFSPEQIVRAAEMNDVLVQCEETKCALLVWQANGGAPVFSPAEVKAVIRPRTEVGRMIDEMAAQEYAEEDNFIADDTSLSP